MTPEEIVAYIKETGLYNVTLTGGEPLLQNQMKDLLERLGQERDLRVEIETNGAVPIAPFARVIGRPLRWTTNCRPAAGNLRWS